MKAAKLVAGVVSPPLIVPPHIVRPQIASTNPAPFTFKTEEQIDALRSTGRLAARILDFALSMAQVGVTTDEIDRATHNEIIKANAYPAPLFYNGFPKSICTSINECAVHGIPDSRKLQAGDVLNIDVTVYKDGVHGDTSRTIIVGEESQIDLNHYKRAKNLIDTTWEAMMAGISVCKPGAPMTAIGCAIQDVTDRENFSIIKILAGHGTGQYFHEDPIIYCYRHQVSQPTLLHENMVFTIEPVVKIGKSDDVELWEDEWTIVTVDRNLTATCEHTILITPTGAEILTVKE